MPLPLCFADLNADWFAQIVTQIDAVETPEELQELVDQVFGTVGFLNSTIESQLALLAPFAGLLIPPVDLATTIAWITSTIVVFTQMYAPYAKMTAQLADIVTEVATMTAAVNAVAAAKFPGVTITIPPVAAFCEI